VKTAT